MALNDTELRYYDSNESRLRKTGQGDKWIFCLTAARIAAIQERR